MRPDEQHFLTRVNFTSLSFIGYENFVNVFSRLKRRTDQRNLEKNLVDKHRSHGGRRVPCQYPSEQVAMRLSTK